MSQIKILCEICSEHIAMADTDTLCKPMLGTMFTSPDPFHGVPAPFDLSATWVHMNCPWCRRRPFMEEDQVLTDRGRITLSEIPAPPKDAPQDQPDGQPETDRQRKLRLKRDWVRQHRAKQKAAKAAEVTNG